MDKRAAHAWGLGQLRIEAVGEDFFSQRRHRQQHREAHGNGEQGVLRADGPGVAEQQRLEADGHRVVDVQVHALREEPPRQWRDEENSDGRVARNAPPAA